MDKRDYTKKNKCIDCGKNISNRATRCTSCAKKYLHKLDKYHYPIGKEAFNYKDGRCSRKYYCIDCNTEINYYTWWNGQKRCYSCAKKGKLHWNFGNIMNIRGSKHPNWKGGIGKEPYPFEFNNQLKKFIRERDNYTCQICGQYGKDVHHIDYDKDNLNPNNLINLCHSCHTATNYNRDIYVNYFDILMGVLV